MTPTFWPDDIFPTRLWPALLWPMPAVLPAPVVVTPHMTSETFPFKHNFPGLYSDGHSAAVTYAISVIEAEWSGIFTMFANLPTQAMVNKQAVLESYLVGWWLGDMYPKEMRGIQGDGGMPISSKSIGGVSISRKDIETQPALAALTTNAFGIKALTMLLSRVERMALIPQGPFGAIPVLTWQQLAAVVLAGGVPAP